MGSEASGPVPCVMARSPPKQLLLSLLEVISPPIPQIPKLSEVTPVTKLVTLPAAAPGLRPDPSEGLVAFNGVQSLLLSLLQ